MSQINNNQNHDLQLDLFCRKTAPKCNAKETDCNEPINYSQQNDMEYQNENTENIVSTNYDFECNSEDDKDEFDDIDFSSIETSDDWLDIIDDHLSNKKDRPLDLARMALEKFPADPYILIHAAFASLIEERPESCLTYIKRLTKRWDIGCSMLLCEAIAYAQQNRFHQAQMLVEKYMELRSREDNSASQKIPAGIKEHWIQTWILRIQKFNAETQLKSQKRKAPPGYSNKKKKNTEEKTDRRENFQNVIDKLPFKVDSLPVQNAQINISYNLPDLGTLKLDNSTGDSLESYLLRLDFAHCALLKGFDELLCLPHLVDVDHYWYQIETVRKVLKLFRGRVLLADEVGLGKTIEAGMILKEYILRVMADRVLILTPPSLVGQWREEMESKFKIKFRTTSDSLFKSDPKVFWGSARIIASIAIARRKENFEKLVNQSYDIIIVDEAHHLKNRNTKNWKLVDALKKRFLLLLSATPIQNNLVELYNLLTLLKPGIFKTEKDFRSIYMVSGNSRMPANKEKLQNLMRDVMIRNTRSLVDVRLPPRSVLTIQVDPLQDELSCYRDIERLIREDYKNGPEGMKMTMRHMLAAAGSSPLAASSVIGRYLNSTSNNNGQWRELYSRYADIKTTGKIEALFDIIKKNRSEKKIVFVRYRDTLELLDSVFRSRGIIFTRFEGQMTALQKDESIERFRSEPQVEILLCTETGGEGRNIQFCNTMINFDLPWNPQAIEQRIGRIHRIGQEREVFIFNLTLKNSVEARVLGILDEKINMFELVVGEMQSILGEMDDEQDFHNLIFSTWLDSTDESVENAFDALGDRLLHAKDQYNRVKALDDEIFGEEFEVV